MLVLYVDDDIEDFEIFNMALAEINRNITVMYASDGDEAYQLLNERLTIYPDVVFLDINMLRMDGLTFLAELRANPKLKDIRVVVLSTSSNPREIKRIEELSAKFIPKHTEFKTLIEAIASSI
jgi:CheY-like chemotaxis protein